MLERGSGKLCTEFSQQERQYNNGTCKFVSDQNAEYLSKDRSTSSSADRRRAVAWFPKAQLPELILTKT